MYVWHWRQPVLAKSSAPARLRVVGEALLLRPLRHEHDELGAEASVAVAPLYVRTAIEMIVSTAATIATGRRDGLRSRRRS